VATASASAAPARRVAVVGAGWAGLAAAVRAVEAGHGVEVFEMGRRAGGRASSHDTAEGRWDNGQHILIGAYRETLTLMRTVGVDGRRALHRCPLALRRPDGDGLALPSGAPALAFLRGIAAARGWTLAERGGLLLAATGWALRGFRCPPSWSVDRLCRGLPTAVRRALVEPLCVAALNTPAARASAAVFLRVLRDALFAGRGGADLLLPRVPLAQLLAEPATAWLAARGARLRWGQRVMRIASSGGAWHVDGEAFDAVVLATTATEAARLTAPIAPGWSNAAGSLEHEPIVTVWLADPKLRWPAPIVALPDGDDAPAQFAFDLGALGHAPGRFSFVASGAARWVERGTAEAAQAVLAQARRTFPGGFAGDAAIVHACTERRATFACTPALRRPPPAIAPGLAAAGDYVDGPYPATLEGAVRSGPVALEAALAHLAEAPAPTDLERVQRSFAMRK
jgi:squalene-associated FAD-dependent desaturase